MKQKFRRGLAILLIGLMVWNLIPIRASADDIKKIITVEDNGTFTITEWGYYVLTGTASMFTLNVEAECGIYLRDLNIDNAQGSGAPCIRICATAKLIIDGTNTIKAGGMNGEAVPIFVRDDRTLTILGMDNVTEGNVLNVIGTSDGKAAIGGSWEGGKGNIIIDSGTIIARGGGNGSAAIGTGGGGAPDFNVTINGGDVTATLINTKSNAKAIHGKNLSVYEHAIVYGGTDADSATRYQNAAEACAQPYVRICPCSPHVYDDNGVCVNCQHISATVTYDANGATSGTAPIDNKAYEGYGSVTVPITRETGNLMQGELYLVGWSENADGSGETYYIGDQISITGHKTLYAKYGPALTDTVGSETITFMPWGSSNSLPSQVGNYYLMKDVALSRIWDVPTGEDGVELHLNGHEIRKTDNGDHWDNAKSAIRVPKDASLKLYDNGTESHTVKEQTFTGGYITGGEGTHFGNAGDDNQTRGGGILVYGSLEMFGGTIIGNSGGSYGGGVGIYGGSFTMWNGTIAGNNAGYGGGVLVDNNGSFTLYDGTIRNNTATEGGGGVLVKNGNFTMQGGSIKDNKCKYECVGGGVLVNDGIFTMLGGEISGNYGGFGAGAGVQNGGSRGYIVLQGGTITDNMEEKCGSAIHIHNTAKGDALRISGSPIINGTINLHPSNKVIKITGALDIDQPIQVSISGDKALSNYTTGTITSGWNTYMGTADPTDYFDSVLDKFVVMKNGDELLLGVKLSELTEEYTAKDGAVLTGMTDQTIRIANNASITLNDATIGGGIVCEGNATITLVGSNSVTGPELRAGIQVGGAGTKLTIRGDGSLTAIGGSNADGIGKGSHENGTMTVGTVIIYDTINVIEASSISPNITYKHIEYNNYYGYQTESDVTENVNKYFNIMEDGDRRIIMRAYFVKIADVAGGTITADKTENVKRNDTVTLTVTPLDGFLLESISYNDGSDHVLTPVDGVYSFTMPLANVTVNAVFATDPAHFSDDGNNTYTIHTSKGWNMFCEFLQDNDTWNRFSGKTVLLGNSIDISTSAGSSSHEFRGTFNGQGYTLNASIDEQSTQGTAPFREIIDATIKNVKVTGNVTGTTHAAGLVGFSRSGVNTIENCSVAVNVSVPASSGYRHMGGIVGHGIRSTLNIVGCVFSGTMNNSGDYAGGLQGWSDGNTLNVTNSLCVGNYTGTASSGFHPIAIQNRSSGTRFTDNGAYYTVNPSLTSSSYIVGGGGKRVYAVSGDEDIVVGAIGDPTVYDVSGITAYGGGGLSYENNLYYVSGDTVRLALSHGTAAEGYSFDSYTVNAGTLTGNEVDGYALTIPGENVTISPTWMANTYIVSFNANGGTGEAMVEQDFTYDEETKALTANTYSREGYEFIGWNTVATPTAENPGIAYEDQESVQNLTTETNGSVMLYAQWRKLVCTVMVYSRTTENATSVANIRCTADAGGVMNGSSVTVTAPDKQADGYSFMGWYEVTAVSNGEAAKYGSRLSQSLAYTFNITKDMSLTAVYKANGKATVTIESINLAEYRVNDSETERSGSTETVQLGQTMTLTAADADKVFQWQNESGKVLGTGATLSFTVTGDTYIKLVYKTNKDNVSYLQFVSDYGQVLSYKLMSRTDGIDFPTKPTKIGYTFSNWRFQGINTVADETTIREKIGTEKMITVVPKYTKDEAAYSVTVEYRNGDATIEGRTEDVYGDISVGSGYTVTAPEIEGYVFECWKDEAGMVLGYQRDYFLLVSGNITLQACYVVEGSEVQEPKPIIMLTGITKTASDDVHKVIGMATRSIPEGYTLVEHGMLYGKTDFSADDFQYGTSGVYRYISSDEHTNGVLYVNVKVADDDMQVYFRGYMIVKDDATGNQETYYTDICHDSYNSVK